MNIAIHLSGGTRRRLGGITLSEITFRKIMLPVPCLSNKALGNTLHSSKNWHARPWRSSVFAMTAPLTVRTHSTSNFCAYWKRTHSEPRNLRQLFPNKITDKISPSQFGAKDVICATICGIEGKGSDKCDRTLYAKGGCGEYGKLKFRGNMEIK